MDEITNIWNTSKKDLQQLSKDMRLPCSGTKNQIARRICDVLGLTVSEESQVGGTLDKDKADYFSPDSSLNEEQKKYCRCILHTAAKQPDWCLTEKAWRQNRNGKGCYNPYAICTKSTGRSGPQFECVPSYNLDNIPEQELNALGKLKGKSIAELREKASRE